MGGLVGRGWEVDSCSAKPSGKWKVLNASLPGSSAGGVYPSTDPRADPHVELLGDCGVGARLKGAEK